jgi:hypothetical protein
MMLGGTLRRKITIPVFLTRLAGSDPKSFQNIFEIFGGMNVCSAWVTLEEKRLTGLEIRNVKL